MQWRGVQIFLVLAAGLGACSRSQEAVREQVAAPKAPLAAVVLDVPALVGLSIDSLAGRLGRMHPVPASFVDPANVTLLQQGYVHDSSVLFRSRGLSLVATFNYRSRQVLDLVVLGTDEELLMQRAHLQPETTSYIVLPIFQQQRPADLFGLRVVPAVLAE